MEELKEKLEKLIAKADFTELTNPEIVELSQELDKYMNIKGVLR